MTEREATERVMVVLVGEQPVPVLLPIQYLQPDSVVLVHTDRTREIAGRLRSLLEPETSCNLCEVPPYDLAKIEDQLVACLGELPPDAEITFNLTSGTKPMALATLGVADRLACPFLYVQSEGNTSHLFWYRRNESGIVREHVEDLPATLSLDDHLRVHLGNYVPDKPRTPFESQVAAALEAGSGIDEFVSSLRPRGLEALEIDFVLRCGNQIGIGEVKTKGDKGAIDQLNGASSPVYFGTYARKFLVTGRKLHHNNLALAKAYQITVIHVPSYEQTGQLSPDDGRMLADTIVRALIP